MRSRSPFSRLCNARTRPKNEFEGRAIGALKIIVQSAHIDGPGWRWRQPNASVTIRTNSTKLKTETQPTTYDPSWITSTFHVLVKSSKQEVEMRVYDDRRVLGEASFDMSLLVESRMKLDAQLPFSKHHKRRGDLLCSLFYFPIALSPKNDSDVGIVCLTLHRAEGLRRHNSMPIARIRLAWDAPAIHITRPGKMIENELAVWESMHEFLCFNKSACVVYIDVLNNRREEQVVGHVCISLTDLVEATDTGGGRWPLSGSVAGKLVASAEWRPLDVEPDL
ncbi:Tricalbin [Mycena sanguinolenta]|uniref:Tricalbin n=1 Tax=Mycena sanguinolenta TaxID=230812 RepID=A0A8H6YVL5_9AGAR|nr:Tricalbin [Mycena sanguinolenta]